MQSVLNEGQSLILKEFLFAYFLSIIKLFILNQIRLMKIIVGALIIILTLTQSIQILKDIPDLIIPVSSSWASEFQPGGGEIAYSIDRNFSSVYHSRWGGLTTFPVVLRYSFTNANMINYVTVVPRQLGTNGLFGQFELWVKTASKASYKYGKYDFKMSAATQTIFFTPGLSKPTEIQFRVLSGSGDFVSCAQVLFFNIRTPYPKNTVEVPIGGNSYITLGATGRVTDSGFVGWSSQNTVLSTYFKVNTPGTLNLFLKATVLSQSLIQVKFANKVYNVRLVSRIIQRIGTIQNCTVGYVRVNIKGISKTDALFAAPSAILLSGPASSNMNYVSNNFSFYWGRRGPSDHMSYTLPQGKISEWFYNQLRVPAGYDPVGSYFMSNGFDNGYFGIQVNSLKQRRVLFSVWSPYITDDPTTIPSEYQVILAEKGEGVIINNFGGEGSGGQSYFLYNWTAGKTYKFLTRARPVENGYTEYTSYFRAPEFADWKFIARFLRPKTNSYYTGAHSFLQNFNPDQGFRNRKVFMSNQWVFTTSKEWIQLTEGTFTCDETGNVKARVDCAGGSDSRSFYLRNCGFFNQTTPGYSKFMRPPSNSPPSISFVK